MPRDAGKPSVANLRSSAQAVRSAISGQSGAIADALTAIAGALDQVQAAVESLEGKNRELASPDTNDPRRRSTAYVSGDRIVGGVSVQGSLQTVAGQSLDLTLQDQVARIAAVDHNTGSSLPLTVNAGGGNVGVGTASPLHALQVTVSANNGEGILVVPKDGWAATRDVSIFLGYTDHYIRGVYSSEDIWSSFNGQKFQNASGTVMTVGASGSSKVGIGTTNPQGALDVQGGRSFFSASSEKYGVGVRYVAGGGAVYFGAVSNSATPDAAISAATGAELMRLTNSGNVGIGTASPTSPLQVVNLPVYANNAAAVAGGLTAGAFYRTGANPDPVCVVH